MKKNGSQKEEKKSSDDAGEGQTKNVSFFIAYKTPLIIVSLTVVIIMLVGISSYFYLQYKSTPAQVSQNSLAKAEAQQLVSEVGKLMALPQTEQPTIATVSDKTKLIGQPFFVHAENGDKVLIYTASKKAILYRPSAHKIIDVAPVNIATAPTQTQTLGATVIPSQTPVRIAIYNGTTVVGFTKTIGATIEQHYPAAKVVKRADAADSTYEKTVVIDLTGKNGQLVKEIAAGIAGEVINDMPSGEVNPETDILIILGQSTLRN